MSGCGIKGINGEYTRCGIHDGVPTYSKRGHWKGRRHVFTLLRNRIEGGKKVWSITIITGKLLRSFNLSSFIKNNPVTHLHLLMIVIEGGNVDHDIFIFYLCFTNSLANVPPMHNWIVASHEADGKGEEPAPTFVHAFFKR